MKDLSLLPLFIYSIIYSCINILFCVFFGYSSIIIHCVVQIILAVSIFLLVGFCVPLTWFQHCVWFFFFFFHITSLLSGIPGSSSVFSALILDSFISLRSIVSAYQRIVLETKIWVLGMLSATGVCLFSSPLS